MACRRSWDKPLSQPMMVSLLTYRCVTRPQWLNSIECDASIGYLIHLFNSPRDEYIRQCALSASIEIIAWHRGLVQIETEMLPLTIPRGHVRALMPYAYCRHSHRPLSRDIILMNTGMMILYFLKCTSYHWFKFIVATRNKDNKMTSYLKGNFHYKDKTIFLYL